MAEEVPKKRFVAVMHHYRKVPGRKRRIRVRPYIRHMPGELK